MSMFENLFLKHSFGELGATFGRQVDPTPLENTRVLTINQSIADKFGLTREMLQSDEFLGIMAANAPISGLAPFAMKYTGHQFGVYNPHLGDGRGLLLGEIRDSRDIWQDWHLKGAGQTPYSRQADGRAVLRSSIREYLAGAAMTGLGIATTEALSIATSDTPVWREQQETGATLLRVAESHVRFGHFEYLFYTKQHEEQKQLADYLIRRHFPELASQPKPYLAFFTEVVKRTAIMIAKWQAYGFCHGVMNTDNMSILGLTFDYGPYAFLDDYQSGFICNHSDHSGRYAFDRQPDIGMWNLSALGYALSPLIDSEGINEALAEFSPTMVREYSHLMQKRLGLEEITEGDSVLFDQLFTLMEEQHIDFNHFFRVLSHLELNELARACELKNLGDDPKKVEEWLHLYAERISDLSEEEDLLRRKTMSMHNPKYVLRTYLAQQAIEEAEKGSSKMIEDLVFLLSSPFDEHPEYHHLSLPPGDDGKGMVLTCSS
ncbi:protein adenylyltransferase SelO [Veronia pacifica]|uniref:Protein nucleotidyltransferase YdiU n=1 Tax=Veronia pacifica TaxID=1080227 RepID=A0A1C3ECE9_9GAMM|nr:YdiU family protein [Veronia pacifica]ODA30937.1 hypothetical protein A8L45_18540 [Veronia pacifica]